MPGGYLGENGVKGVQRLETLKPRTPNWKPPHRLLRAALALDASRFHIADKTVSQFLAHPPRKRLGLEFFSRRSHVRGVIFDGRNCFRAGF